MGKRHNHSDATCSSAFTGDCVRENPRLSVETGRIARRSQDKLGSVVYVGFSETKKTSAHSLKDLDATIKKAIKKVELKWRWKCGPLYVAFHARGKAMGRTWPRVKVQGRRYVSLAKNLVSEYDLMSIQRTMEHELCHQFREERFPVPRFGVPNGGHDDVFCRELSRVDPIVGGNKRTCRYFVEQRDEKAMLSSLKAQVSRAGRFVIGLNSVVWVPGSQAYSSRKAYLSVRLTDDALVTLMGVVGRARWKSVKVQDDTGYFWKGQKSLYQFAQFMVRARGDLSNLKRLLKGGR